MKIKLKESVSIEEMNELLKRMSLTQRFNTEQDNVEWLNDINNNPLSPQKHLKPKDRKLSMDELKAMFELWTEIGVLDVDIHFGRTPLEEMQGLASFIEKQKENIEFITESELLIERGELENNFELLKGLEKPIVEPELLPDDVYEEQKKLQGGQLLCESWGNEPFWLIFGSTTKGCYDVSFLKEKRYVENKYNKLYKDKNGYGYMLMPLYDFSPDFFDTVFENAYELGLREHPAYISVLLYGYDIMDPKSVAKSLIDMYTANELEERFKIVIERIHDKCRRVALDSKSGLIKSIAQHDVNRDGKENLINAFSYALQETYGEFVYGVEMGDFYKFVFKDHSITVKNNSQ